MHSSEKKLGLRKLSKEELTLIDKYKSVSAGIRKEKVLEDVCIKCGSTSLDVVMKFSPGYKFKCNNCEATWTTDQCPTCGENIDSRDELNIACPQCEWPICTCGVCGACDFKLQKAERVEAEPEELFDEPDFFVYPETCDWCGVHAVSYRDEAYSLCEMCADQLRGD